MVEGFLKNTRKNRIIIAIVFEIKDFLGKRRVMGNFIL